MSQSVKVGDRTYNIAAFKGFKAVRVGRIIAQITKEAPAIVDRMGDFTREYEQKNVIRITRSMSVLPRFKPLFDDMKMTPEEWEATGGAVEIPQSPEPEMVMAAVFPLAFEFAEDRVVELLAWIAAPNSELKDADEAGEVDKYISDLSKRLLHEGDLEELLALAIAGAEVVREQFAGKVEQLGKLISTFTGRQDSEPLSSTSSTVDVESSESDTTKPNSSTDSLPPTDGPEVKPSTELSGATS